MTIQPGIESVFINSVENEYLYPSDNACEFKIDTIYLNTTCETFNIILRNNVSVPITPVNTLADPNNGFVTIRKIYHIRGRITVNSIMNYIHEFQKNNGTKKDDLNTLYSCLKNLSVNGKNLNNVQIALDRNISLSTLRKHKHVYIPQDDVLISSAVEGNKYHHPYSAEGVLVSEITEDTLRHKGTGFFIQSVDNEQSINRRFIYIAKEAMEIQSVKDSNRESGLYTVRSYYDEHTGTVKVYPRFYSHEDGKELLGVHKTAEEAISGGDPELLSKADYEKAKKDLIELKHKSELDKTLLENEILTNKRELTTASSELEKIKVSYDRLKEELDLNKAMRQDYFDERKSTRNDRYEERSYDRKESLELWKWIPAVAVAGAGLYTIFKK